MNRISMEFHLNEKSFRMVIDDCPDPESTFKSVIKWDNIVSDGIDFWIFDRTPQAVTE